MLLQQLISPCFPVAQLHHCTLSRRAVKARFDAINILNSSERRQIDVLFYDLFSERFTTQVLPPIFSKPQMTSEHLSHHDYTVGWVCALPKELIAAAAMLDETHPDLPRPSNDHNAYTLGRISGHHVVLACLPKGEIGNNNAATVATQMIATFPSIKFGLMVGIGGGVPKTVRLGDVVVSIPTNE